MLSIGLISLLIAVPIFSYRITPSLFNRITSVILIYSALLSFNGLYVESLASGVGLYSGLFHVSSLSIGVESFLLFVGSLIILGWAPVVSGNIVAASPRYSTLTIIPTISEYSLIILFTTIGASLLISSSDLVSIYLSIELQRFAVYILATLYRDSESSTAAGLKYFLLGGLSSAVILLGTALIYSYTGLTQFESIYTLIGVCSPFGEGSEGAFEQNFSLPVVLGIVLIGIGFLFKVAAAPFHNWAPDVYDGVPTIVTSWLTTIPKISIFIFLLELQRGLEGRIESLSVILGNEGSLSLITSSVWKNLLLVTSLLSLVVGTVVGLSQYRIKRLLAFSTISHVGFLLLALAINTEESIESFIFYIIQYSLTNVNTFLILLAFVYIRVNYHYNRSWNTYNQRNQDFISIEVAQKESNFPLYSIRQKNRMLNTDIQFIDDLKGQFKLNPLLGFSLALCLFSIAGIPPLIGFFAKQMVLYSSVHAGYYFLSLVAILVSVISASYYLKIVRTIYFDSVSLEKKAFFFNFMRFRKKNAFGENRSKMLMLKRRKTKITEINNIMISERDIHRNMNNNGMTTIHSMLISIFTITIRLFVLQPSILLNSCHLLALSLFYY